MQDMGFSPCKAAPCVWLRKAKCSTKYEYIAIYVNDILIACTCASEFIHTLKRKHNLKIKGDGPLMYHLGCDYHLDPDGTLVALPKNNRILAPKHTNSVGLRVETNLSSLCCSIGRSQSNKNKTCF